MNPLIKRSAPLPVRFNDEQKRNWGSNNNDVDPWGNQLRSEWNGEEIDINQWNQ